VPPLERSNPVSLHISARMRLADMKYSILSLLLLFGTASPTSPIAASDASIDMVLTISRDPRILKSTIRQFSHRCLAPLCLFYVASLLQSVLHDLPSSPASSHPPPSKRARHAPAHYKEFVRQDNRCAVTSTAAAAAAPTAAVSATSSAATVPAAHTTPERYLPAHVLDAPLCLTERGFAFVAEFGKAFAHHFNKSMGAYLAKQKPQPIAGEVCIQER
jgi:hypothetical protein